MSEANEVEDELEIEIEGNPNEAEDVIAPKAEVELDIVDDTPEEDRGKEPMPQEIVDELEADELEEYSDKVKQRLKQMKKVWHDERRGKETAVREQNEAVAMTKRLLAENQQLKNNYRAGERTLVETYKAAAELEVGNAKRAYKEAYDAGDTDKLLDAEEALSKARGKITQVENYRPSLQEARDSVQGSNVSQAAAQQAPPEPDENTKAWQKRNTWFGSDIEMTSLAMGYHQQLAQQEGEAFLNTPEYWTKVDKQMRRRFPEYFSEDEQTTGTKKLTDSGGGKPTETSDTKPVNIVAAASRSTAPRKIRLSKTQVTLAKRLGLTNEQYAAAAAKLQKEQS